MKASELRLGNYVLRNGFLQEDKETFNKIVVSHNDITACVVASESFQPIPLTKEWLLKFGFEINPENFNWNAGIGENAIMDFKLSLRYTEEIGWFYKSRCTPIKYVHQLQNLYFAITGEELIIKNN